MSWKSFIETKQAKRYVLPKGWSKREDVADEIGCSPDNVRKLLGPEVKDGTVEFKVFPVWDDVTRRVKSVTAYRRTPKSS